MSAANQPPVSFVASVSKSQPAAAASKARTSFLTRPTLSRIAVLTALLLTATAAFTQAVRFPGATPVAATAAPQSVTLTLPHGGTIAAVKALTQGVPKLDFAATPGTCTVGATFLPGQTCTLTAQFSPTAPGERRGALVLLDSANTPIATQFLVAEATGGVGAFIPGTMTTAAGDAAWIYAGDGTPGDESSIFLPFGIAIDAAGNLFIADSSNNRIRRVDAVSHLISTIAGTGVIGATGDGGPASSASLSNPTSVALDPAGNLFFADSANNVIRRIDAFTGIISTVAGIMGQHGATGDLGPATAATLNNPNGIAFDSLGTLLIADSGNHLIRAVSPAGILSTVAGRGIAAFSGDGGPAVSAGLSSPWSVTPSPTGELYIADQNNQRIRKIDIAGNISTVIGTGIQGFSGDQGPASQAQLNVPAFVALDVAGNLYVADSGNNRVRKVSSKTGLITTIAGSAGEAPSGDFGPADQAELYGPYTLALDGQGSLLIADVFHNRVRKITTASATLPFPPMRVGRISAPLPQTFENDGNAPLTPSALTAVLNSQLDPNATTCSLSSALEPLAQCVLSLQFAPTTVGDLVPGTFSLVSDAANSPAAVTLRGQVLNVDPSTVTLTSSANPATTGAPITFSVTVSSDGATPTGQVTLLDGTTAVATAQLAAGGLASFTVSTLTAGSHIITVAYAGDGSNSSATSAPLTQLVKDAQAATTTLLTSSASPIDSGATLRLTASTSVTTPGSGTGTLIGNVAFKEGLNTLGTATLDAQGIATLAVTSFAPGSHSILAVYQGSPTYNPSTSAPLSQLVTVASTRLALSTSANPNTAGAPLTITATILSTGGTPTGRITFTDGATNLGTATLDGAGQATLTVPGATWLPGTHTLTATYAGDTNDSPSTSPSLAESVTAATAAATLTSSLNPSPLSASLALTATLTSNSATPTGTVTFLDGATILGTATLPKTGTATLATSTLTLGDHALSVTYTGDAYTSATTSQALRQTISTTTVAVTLSPSNDPALFSTPVTFTAHITASGAAPTGTVALTEGPTTLATAPADANGNATFTLSDLPIGPHLLTAVYAGDASHAQTSSAVLSERILQRTTLTLTTPAAHITAGLPATFSLALTGASGQPITGAVTLAEGPSTLATLTPDAAGNATWSTTAMAPGAHTLTASYPGDQLNAAASSSPMVETVTIAATTTTLAASANPVNAASPVTFTATVAGNGATPAGSVTFSDGSSPITTVPLTGATATFTTSALAPGIHTITATYSGDANDAPSTSPALSEQVARLTTLTLTSSANPSLLTDSITLTLTALNGDPAPPTGSVTLTDGPITLATLPLMNGIAAYTYTPATVGTHALAAAYPGDAQNHPATAPTLMETVNLRPSTTTFTPSSTALSNGQQLILISVVQAQGPKAPTGTVTFASPAAILGTATINSAGIATLTVNPAQAIYSLTAQYSGDTLYAPSTSPAVSVTVGPPVEFTLTATPATLKLKSGDHTALTLNLTTNPTFKDTLAFGCAGLPAYATCNFSENQVAAGGGLPHTLTVTIDTGNPLEAGAQATFSDPTTRPGSRPSAPYLCIFPAMIFLALFHPRKRNPNARSFRLPPRIVVLLLTLGLIGALTGCGSTFTQHATPAGAYTFQIVATGNTTAATNTATIQLEVTQ